MRDEPNRPAGKYRTKAIIQHNVPVQAANGAMVPGSWVTFKTAWVHVIPRSGRERFLNGADTAAGDTSIFTPYTPGITEKMRLLIGGVIYSIDAPPINRMMRNREWELICSTGLNNG